MNDKRIPMQLISQRNGLSERATLQDSDLCEGVRRMACYGNANPGG